MSSLPLPIRWSPVSLLEEGLVGALVLELLSAYSRSQQTFHADIIPCLALRWFVRSLDRVVRCATRKDTGHDCTRIAIVITDIPLRRPYEPSSPPAPRRSVRSLPACVTLCSITTFHFRESRTLVSQQVVPNNSIIRIKIIDQLRPFCLPCGRRHVGGK